MESLIAAVAGAVLGGGGKYLFDRFRRPKAQPEASESIPAQLPLKSELMVWFWEARAGQEHLEAHSGMYGFDPTDTRRGIVQRVMRQAALHGYSLDYATAKELLKEF